jgi:integrase/recombinase XerD
MSETEAERGRNIDWDTRQDTDRHTGTLATPGPETPFGAACAAFLEHGRYARNHADHRLRAYAQDLAEAERLIGADRPVAQITRQDLKDYAQALFDGGRLSEASIKRRLACLRALFGWLEDEGAVELSPFHRLRLNLRLPRRLPRGLSAAEMRRLLATAARDLGLSQPGRYAAGELQRLSGPATMGAFTQLVAVELLFATGMRVGELCGLDRRDVDLDAGTIYLRGKGDRERAVFLPDADVRQLLASYLDLAPVLTHADPATTAVLLTPRGRPATTQHVRTQMRALGERAGLTRRLTPHMLRHTAATHLLEAGVDLRYVQRLLGHQSVATTQMYTAVTHASLKAVVSEAGVRGGVMG